MAADAPLTRRSAPPPPRWHLSRLPPAGQWLGVDAARRLLAGEASGASLEQRIAAALGGGVVELHRSGRAALSSALMRLAEGTGRDEVIVPAYTCYSVPAAAVAAGLRVRLVDVDARGRIAIERLAALPLERAAAVVVSNLFGLAEPIEAIAALAGEHGVAVVDDAAQALGAVDARGPVGARGDVGVLSFGRGKPVSALGGGAAWWPASSAARAVGAPHPAGDPPAAIAALLRLALYDLALVGPVFRLLAAIPALRIGETVFDPGFAGGGIDGASRALLVAVFDDARTTAAARREQAQRLAARIARDTAWRPLTDGAGSVHPRLAVLAPDRARRDAALARLTRLGAGAARLYPESLDGLPPLAGRLAAPADTPAARRLADRLLTLPTHGRLRGRRLERALGVLAELG